MRRSPVRHVPRASTHSHQRQLTSSGDPGHPRIPSLERGPLSHTKNSYSRRISSSTAVEESELDVISLLDVLTVSVNQLGRVYARKKMTAVSTSILASLVANRCSSRHTSLLYSNVYPLSSHWSGSCTSAGTSVMPRVRKSVSNAKT